MSPSPEWKTTTKLWHFFGRSWILLDAFQKRWRRAPLWPRRDDLSFPVSLWKNKPTTTATCFRSQYIHIQAWILTVKVVLLGQKSYQKIGGNENSQARNRHFRSYWGELWWYVPAPMVLAGWHKWYICVMCIYIYIYIYIFVYVNPKVRFITNHIIPHCFVSADCSITCGFLRSQFVRSAVISSSFPARCRHDLDRPTVPWRRPPRNLPRIVEFLTVPSKNHTTKFMEKTANSVFFISVTVFPLPRRTEKKIQKPRDKTGETVAIETVAPGVQNQTI